jgi:pimeloyl-ACP methyl ester carboxylesterase
VDSAQKPSELLHFVERGSGPPLLLLHGLMVTGEMFEPVMESLAARNRLIVPDLRGHGQSRALPPPYATARLAADLSLLLDHLDIESAAVLGYSHGGAVAQQWVLDYPRRCGRLVLACTYAFNMATYRENIEGHLVPFLIRVLGMNRFAKFVISRGLKHLGKDRAEWLADIMARQDGELMASAWRDAMAFDSRRRLTEIACPTLIVAGSNDLAVPLHHAKMLQDGIKGSLLAIIDGADHTLIWTHTEQFVRLTNEFLVDSSLQAKIPR